MSRPLGGRPDVLHVLSTGGLGGAQRAVYQLALAQHALGDRRVALAFARGGGHYYELARSKGPAVYDFEMAGAADLPAAIAGRKVFRNYRTHHFHAAEPLLMLSSLSCPDVTRIYTHRAGRHAYDRRRALRYRLLRPLLRRFDAVTGTEQAALAVQEAAGVPLAAVLRTFNGVDIESLRPAKPSEVIREEQGVGPETAVIGTAANLRAWKRIDWLVDAAAGLTGDDWVVWILGDGPDRARLESCAAASPAAPRIRFLGMKPEIGSWLASLDVFVLPSGPGESFGNAVVEAMAVGLPTIVCADCPAHRQHIEDGRTGLYAQDQAHLVELLRRLIDEPELRRRLGRAGSEEVLRRYSMDRVVSRFEEVYLSGPPRSLT